MSTGTIKFFNAGKGFGFVTPDGGGADIFLPGAAATAAGIGNVKPGQRVSFEQAPDKKGPKIVSIQMLEPLAPKAPVVAAPRVTVYCDPASEAVADVLSTVRAAGYQLQMVDYITAPPGPDQLRHLSHLLTGSGKSLVRRHDPLFSALQLDDRFIGDHEFWTAVAEHPTLINGPLLVMGSNARICRSPDDVKAFLGIGGDAPAAKPKTLSPRLAALLRGAPLPKETVAEPAPAKPVTAVKTAPAPVEESAPVKKTKAKAKAAPKAAAATKPKKAVVKAVRKPVKKSAK